MACSTDIANRFTTSRGFINPPSDYTISCTRFRWKNDLRKNLPLNWYSRSLLKKIPEEYIKRKLEEKEKREEQQDRKQKTEGGAWRREEQGRKKETRERKPEGNARLSSIVSLSHRTTIGWKNGTHRVVGCAGGREVGCRGVAGARDGWRGWYLPSPRALTGRYSNNTGKHREINMASVALFPLASPCLSSSRSPRFAQTSTLSLLPSLPFSLATLAPLLSLPRPVSLLLTPFNPLSVSFPVGLPRSARTGEPIMRGCYSGPIPNHPERENWRDESPRRAHVRC